jgi:hypothetical protein
LGVGEAELGTPPAPPPQIPGPVVDDADWAFVRVLKPRAQG